MKRIQTVSPEIQRLQDNVAESVEVLERSLLGRGVLVEGIKLLAGSVNAVEHRLSRQPFGYVIVSQDANAVVWKSTSQLPGKFLSLNASANVTISLWIF